MRHRARVCSRPPRPASSRQLFCALLCSCSHNWARLSNAVRARDTCTLRLLQRQLEGGTPATTAPPPLTLVPPPLTLVPPKMPPARHTSLCITSPRIPREHARPSYRWAAAVRGNVEMLAVLLYAGSSRAPSTERKNDLAAPACGRCSFVIVACYQSQPGTSRRACGAVLGVVVTW